MPRIIQIFGENMIRPEAVLVGLPAAGKTSVGKKLAKILNLDFLDIDRFIEQQEKKTIKEIFSQHGEPHFRFLEEMSIAENIDKTNGVLSLGAGAILSPKTQLLLKQHNVVYLEISKEEGIKRVTKNSKRPLLLADPEDVYNNLFLQRVPIYEKLAKVHIQTRNRPTHQVARQIARSLGYRHGNEHN